MTEITRRLSRIPRFTVNNITPFTYRDGLTFLQLVEELRKWATRVFPQEIMGIIDVLVDELEDANERYDDGVAEFQRIHDAFMEDVNSALMALNDVAVSDLVADSSSLLNQMLERTFTQMESATYRIPSDYPTLQAAIDDLSNKPHKQGVVFNLLIESCHELREGVSVRNGDYSHFRIVSEDSVVNVHDSFTGDLIKGTRAVMPVLATVIDMRGLGTDGYSVNEGSTGYIEQQCGVQNAGYRCAYVNMSSRLNALRSILTGSRGVGLWVARGSSADVEESDFSDTIGNAVSARRSSIIHAQFSTFNNCGTAIIATSASQINAISVKIRNTTEQEQAAVMARMGSVISMSDQTELTDLAGHGIDVLTGATVSASNVTIRNCGGVGIRAYDAGTITADGANVTGCAQGVIAWDSSTVNMPRATISQHRSHAVEVRRGTAFNGERAILSNNAGRGAMIYNCRVELQDATIEDNGSEGVYAIEGATVNVSRATIRNNTGLDIRLAVGSYVTAYSTTTTSTNFLDNTNLNVLNTPVESSGMIWG